MESQSPSKFDFNGLFDKLQLAAKNTSDYAKCNIIIHQQILFDTDHKSIVSFHKDFKFDSMTKIARYSAAITLIELLEKNKSSMLAGNMPPGDYIGTLDIADKNADYTITQEQIIEECKKSDNQSLGEFTKQWDGSKNDQVKQFVAEVEKLTKEKQEMLIKNKEYAIANENALNALTESVNKATELQKQLDNVTSNQPKIIELHLDLGNESKIVKLEDELYHHQFKLLLKLLLSRNTSGYSEFVYGWGAPGCGKTQMGQQLAKSIALTLNKKFPEEFGYHHLACTPQTTEGRIVGFKNQMTGEYIKGVAYEPYKNGGVLALDEVDKSDPSMLAGSCNSLENNYYMFGTELVPRHKDFFLIAWANTKGTGATGGFASNKIDAATLDRLTMIEILYDEELEQRIVTNKDWATYCQRVRKHIKEHCNNSIYITTRAIRKGDAYLQQGNEIDTILNSVLFKLCTPDIRKAIEASCGVYDRLSNIEKLSKDKQKFFKWLDDVNKTVRATVCNNIVANKMKCIDIFKQLLQESKVECSLPYAKIVIENFGVWVNETRALGEIPSKFKGYDLNGKIKPAQQKEINVSMIGMWK